jgi:predicted  nucleic acid-binding Zn-ribbon protein
MERTGLHPALEMRLTELASRIAELKQKMNRQPSLEKIEALGEVTQLGQRYRMLQDQLRSLNQEGPGVRQDLKAEYEKIADDLAANFSDFVIRLDSDNSPR